jgi:hypothetical protein
MDIFLLWHSHPVEGESNDKLIGLYSSEQKAKEAMERSILLPGFAENQDGFEIDRYEIDKDHWKEGFITV